MMPEKKPTDKVLPKKILLDTVILVDHLNNYPPATLWLSSLNHQDAFISPITRAEVLVGATEEEKELVELLLASYVCLEINSQTADLASDFRKTHRVKLPDAFQAALALQHNLNLATRNSKDFQPKKHSFVLVPYSYPHVSH